MENIVARNNKKPKCIEIEWLENSRNERKKYRIKSMQGKRVTRDGESVCVKTGMKMQFASFAWRQTCYGATEEKKQTKNYLLFLLSREE